MNDTAGLLADPAEVRAILISAARAGESITYSEVLALLGHQFSRPKMRQLCKVQDCKVSLLSCGARINLMLFTSFKAVRKNRYVVLPVDFEEAWKVSYLSLFGVLSRLQNSDHLLPFQLPAKRETSRQNIRFLCVYSFC